MLQSIVNNIIRPINVMKLSTEFCEGKTDQDKDEDFDLADIKGINHLLRSFTIYSSIHFWTVPPSNHMDCGALCIHKPALRLFDVLYLRL